MQPSRIRSVATSAALALFVVLALPARALEVSTPRQVLIEATLVEVQRTDLVELGIGTLKPRQRPNQQDVLFFTPLLEDAIAGLTQVNLDIGNDADLNGTVDGNAAQQSFSTAIDNLDLVIAALADLDRAKVISRPLVTAFSSEVAGIAALQGRPSRFSTRASRQRREVAKYDGLLDDVFQELLPNVQFFDLGDYFEPFDRVKKKNFEIYTGLTPGGTADMRLRSRRGNSVLEFRGTSDTPVDGYITTPMQVGNDFAATADLGILLKVTPKITAGRDGLTMFIELEQPGEGTFQRAGFEFGPDGITDAYIANQSGVLSTTSISAISGIDRTSVTSFVEVRDGVAILGGLFKPDSGDGAKVPVTLGQIPVLGALFRTKAGAEGVTKKRRAETDNLIVFLTPRIVTAVEE